MRAQDPIYSGMPNPDCLAPFKGQKYLNLETFRKNGQGVATPVWFVEAEGVLYVRTGAQSGKVKRIRRGGRVRVAPCDARGGLKSEWQEAQASLVDPATAGRVNALLKKKYGLLKRFFDLFSGRMEEATVAIRF